MSELLSFARLRELKRILVVSPFLSSLFWMAVWTHISSGSHYLSMKRMTSTTARWEKMMMKSPCSWSRLRYARTRKKNLHSRRQVAPRLRPQVKLVEVKLRPLPWPRLRQQQRSPSVMACRLDPRQLRTCSLNRSHLKGQVGWASQPRLRMIKCHLWRDRDPRVHHQGSKAVRKAAHRSDKVQRRSPALLRWGHHRQQLIASAAPQAHLNIASPTQLRRALQLSRNLQPWALPTGLQLALNRAHPRNNLA